MVSLSNLQRLFDLASAKMQDLEILAMWAAVVFSCTVTTCMIIDYLDRRAPLQRLRSIRVNMPLRISDQALPGQVDEDAFGMAPVTGKSRRCEARARG
jgi:hypothetical protein